MKKIISFIIVLIAGVWLNVSAVAYNFWICNSQSVKQTEPGVLDLSDEDSPYLLDCLLCGQWEYYPDELIFSDTIKEELSTDTGIVDPAVEGDRRLKDPTYSSFSPEFMKLSSTEPNPDADHIYLPSILAKLRGQTQHYSRESYRLILRNCPEIESVDMVVSITGMVRGSYHLFINGKEAHSFVAPYSYPEYYTTLSENVELVIEVTHSASVFNICPRISYKGIAMSVIDTYKDRMIGISCALVSAFVILMLFIFSLEPARFRWHFGIGLIFSAYYIMINFWATGYLSVVTRFIPLYILSRISGLILQLGFIFIFIALKRFYVSYYPKKALTGMLYLLCISAGLSFSGLFISGAALPVICAACILAAFITWLVLTMKHIAAMPVDLVLFHIGLLILTFGSNIALIYNEFGIPNVFAYMFPCSLFSYIVLVFAAAKYHQKQLMQKTMDLLELERQSTRMQAAMLSSQLQPHFLHNALTGIQEMCYTEPEAAADMIVHLSRYLRRSVDFMDYNDLIPFSRELEHIEDYMYIQRMRYGAALNYEQHLEFTDFQIPPMSVQPLIENAINYGVRKNHNQGSIHLETFLQGHLVHIRITNTGPGFDLTKLKPNHSVCNIRKRLNTLLQGRLEFITDPDASGTIAEIIFRRETGS